MKWTLRDYQVKALKDIDLSLRLNTRTCFAACCGAGKTLTSIAYIEEFKLKNPNAKILVLTHGQVILRNQYKTECDNCSPSFTYAEVSKSSELAEAYKNNDVIILIPQSLNAIADNIPHFDLVIVDEGHQYFFAKGKGQRGGMVQNIIKKSGALYKLALTGTPSPYVFAKWPIVAIAMNTLMPEYLEDVIVELASSSYLVKFDDYDLISGELKEERQAAIFTEAATTETLDNLLKFIYTRLTTIWKNHPTMANLSVRAVPDWVPTIKGLEKSMIACKSQNEARMVKKYFDQHGVKTLISISDEGDSQDAQDVFKTFKEDPEYHLLIVVGRGVLGFNYPDLANVIDMTCSTNIDRIFQLMSRLVRKSDKVKQKLFLKVAPDLATNLPGKDYFHYVMTAVLSLTDEYWFTRFNGKNFLQLQLPTLRPKRKPGIKGGGHPGPKPTPQIKTWLGLPAVQFFKGLWHKDETGSYAYEFSTLGKVREELFGKGYQDPDGNKAAIIAWIKAHPVLPKVKKTAIPVVVAPVVVVVK